MRPLAILAVLTLGVGCSGDSQTPRAGDIAYEESSDLGGGFRFVNRGIVTPPDNWEAIAHYSYLYFRDQEICLCSVGQYSISPSMQFALAHDGPTGQLRLYDVAQEATRNLTESFVGLPEMFVWDEANGRATVSFYQGRSDQYEDAPPISIELR